MYPICPSMATFIAAVLLPQLFVTVYFILSWPIATAETTPEVLPTEAIELLALHIPPELPELVNVIVEPRHKFAFPEMVPAFGNGFTVTTAVTELPETV